jgi:hypothetical protein
MSACRRAWFVGQRAQEKHVPAANPFSRMGLKARSPGQPVRETPTATWDELVAFRAAAKNLGYGSVATAALVAREWLPTYAKRTRKQLISGTKKRREERTKAAGLSE